MALPDGATPLEPEEKEVLIPDIKTREELNEWEQTNIIEARRWLFPTRRSPERILCSNFLKKVHRKMFDHVWEWAGRYRKTEKNIGTDPYSISVECKKLSDNARFWLKKKTYDYLEFCATIHQRLTQIHPFPNGNGRHARLYVDYLSYSLGQAEFTWGGDDLIEESKTRNEYIKALRTADRENIEPLMEFMTKKT
jgi:Fic-DOC domain mobile mystery protein B